MAPPKLAKKSKAPPEPDAAADGEESVLIGTALQRLEAESPLDRRELAKQLGVSYSHFSNLVTNTRGAGLPTISKIAKRSGRAMAFFFGDFEALATIGALDQTGAVAMVKEPQLPALIRVDEDVGPFKAGDLLHVTRTDWEPNRWLVMTEGSDVFIAASFEHAGLRLYRTLAGKTGFIDAKTAARVIGVIQTVTTTPPAPGPVVLPGAEKVR